jgi:hypothetical protein
VNGSLLQGVLRIRLLTFSRVPETETPAPKVATTLKMQKTKEGVFQMNTTQTPGW